MTGGAHEKVRRVEAREASIGDSSPLVVSQAGVPVETFTGE
jgi:hypothetical protein